MSNNSETCRICNDKLLTYGLADELGTVESVARDVIAAPEIVDYTEQEKLADRVLKKFGASVGYGAATAGLDWNPVSVQ